MAVLQKKTSRLILYNVLFVFIVLSGTILRFWNIQERFIFDIDTQYQALFAQTIIDNFHIIWIGVSASNIGYYLGPGLVYLTAFLLWIANGDPIMLGYFSAFVGVVTVASIFYIANSLYNRKVALISGTLYSCSTFIISYDHRYWPIFVPLIAVWIFFSLVKSEKDHRWLIAAVALVSTGYHIHLSLLILWPFILWRFLKSFKTINLRTWIGSLFIYFLITFPLLVFDFVHNFDNLRAPLKFLYNEGAATHIGFNTHFTYVSSLINKVWYSGNLTRPYEILSTLLTLTVLLYLVRNWKQSPLLTTIVFLFTLAFALYPRPIQDYYIVLIFPFIVIATGLLLNNIPLRYLIGLLALFIGVNGYTLMSSQNLRGLSIKKTLIEKTSQKINEPYYLDFEGARDQEGWRYLFAAYGKTPSQSKGDDMFGWLYSQKISNSKLTLKVFVSTKKALADEKTVIYYERFGPFYSYVMQY